MTHETQPVQLKEEEQFKDIKKHANALQAITNSSFTFLGAGSLLGGIHNHDELLAITGIAVIGISGLSNILMGVAADRAEAEIEELQSQLPPTK